MALAHFTNIASHYEKWEPIYKNLFEVTVLLPTALQQVHPQAKVLLLENAFKATLPAYPDLGTQTQRFKYSTRIFVGAPETTSLDGVSISFNLNQNDTLQVFNWRIIKDCYDLSWNNETGELNYKKDMVGDIIINIHDRNGFVVRRVTYHNAMCKHIAGWDDADWSSATDIVSLDAKFAVDYWEDSYY